MQELKQNLNLKAQLSPQQIQLLNLLQTPIALIDKKIEDELEENPALEEEEELDNEENYEKNNSNLYFSFYILILLFSRGNYLLSHSSCRKITGRCN